MGSAFSAGIGWGILGQPLTRDPPVPGPPSVFVVSLSPAVCAELRLVPLFSTLPP